MADPVVIAITPANTWIIVATNITSGMLSVKTNDPVKYFFDNRDTGNAAPTDLTTARALSKIDSEIISNSVAIDVYVYALDGVGSVIIDI